MLALLLLLLLLLECRFEVREGGRPFGMRKGEACVGDVAGGGAGVRGLYSQVDWGLSGVTQPPRLEPEQEDEAEWSVGVSGSGTDIERSGVLDDCGLISCGVCGRPPSAAAGCWDCRGRLTGCCWVELEGKDVCCGLFAGCWGWGEEKGDGGRCTG